MKKNEINKVAEYLGWEFKKTNKAIKDIRIQKSIIKDWSGFFSLCIESQNPVQRTKALEEHLKNIPLKNNLSDTICNWIYNLDPCFNVCSVFNISDYCNLSFTGYEYDDSLIRFWFNNLEKNGSFYFQKRLLPGQLFENSLYEPSGLCDHIISTILTIEEKLDKPHYEYLEKTKPVDVYELKVRTVFANVLKKVGFSAFNISAFRIRGHIYDNNPFQAVCAKEISSILNDKYSNNASSTERRYWIYFILVEKLKDEYGVRGSFREIAKRFDKTLTRKKDIEKAAATIHARYYEMQKEYKRITDKNPGYGIDDIVSEYNLSETLESYKNLRSLESRSI